MTPIAGPTVPGRRTASIRRRFALALGAVWLVLLLLRLHPVGEQVLNALYPLDLATARVTAGLLRGLGVDAIREGAVLSHPSGFGYLIYGWCLGLHIAAFLAAGLLALPGRLGDKMAAAIAGTLLVLVLNQARLVSLFLVGIRAPAAYDIIHRGVWPGLMITAVLGVWLGWMRKAGGASTTKPCNA